MASPILPFQRHLALEGVGRFFNLREIFDQLNEHYFPEPLYDYRITWGRARRQRPVAYFVFATIQEEERLIRVHPLLDADFVPRWFMDYVVFHEMLHAHVPDEWDAARRRRVVHTGRFRELERRFPHYRRARRWEAENLARFLR